MIDHNIDNTKGFYEENDQSFRDSISTVDKDGKRVWLYPKNPKGRLTTYRHILSAFFILMMVSAPFITIDGEPLLLLNVIERKFIIFGKIFWPQDFFIFMLIMIAFIIIIALFTVIYGRIFCGWICPQTIFMESVFRKIEFWIEGDWKYRISLDRASLGFQKVFKKTLKHVIFFAISFIIANIFLSYIVGVYKLQALITEGVAAHTLTFVLLVVFSLAFYWVFARFREQVCTTICPYGRLQGVLLDRNSLVVIYDYVRGEKRGKLRAKEDRKESGKGDCIECHQCVDVCPMGIDIRNGTQLECTNCTACIDACNHVMLHVGLPQNLIKIDSEAAVAEGKQFKFSPRIIGYTLIIIALSLSIVALLAFRTDVETSMLRTPGVMYQTLENNKISNLYQIKMINKTSKEINVTLKVMTDKATLKLIGKDFVLPPQGTAETAAFIIMDKADIKNVKSEIELKAFAGDKELDEFNTVFMGPQNN